MELSSRKQAVLKAIVKAYIETGEPVGSKNLTLMLENAPSSATLRNEMSELCELGLLKQPHTSAGRIPTIGGYRVYVNDLMGKDNIPENEADFINRELSALHCEPEEIPAAAAQMLTKLTGLPAFSCIINISPPKLKRIELLPISRATVMLLLITEDGRTRNKIFRQSKDFSPEAKKCYDEIVQSKIKGKQVNELTKAYMQSLIASAGIYSLEIMPIIAAIFEMAANIEETDLTVKGKNALYSTSASEEDATRILSLLNRRDPIISILEGIGDNIGVVFGADTGYNELRDGALVASRFSVSDKYKGYIGVIGPNRISYEQIMPDIEYTAERLTEIITQAQKDMED